MKSKTLAVLGLSFKSDTDDVRFAPAIDIIRLFQAEGASIRAYDPEAMPNARALLKDVVYAKNPYEAIRGADALLVLTEWDEFTQLDFKKIKKLLRHPVLFDGRNMFDAEALKKLGFRYYGIGRPA